MCEDSGDSEGAGYFDWSAVSDSPVQMGGTSMPSVDASTFAVVIGVLLGVSEALSLIPSVKANGIFQFIVQVLKALAGRKD